MFGIEGADVPQSGHLALGGAVADIVQTGGRVEIALVDEMSREVTVRLEFARPVRIDLQTGSEVEIDYWRRQGFEGTADGIRIRDDSGLVLIADDGDYGNAIVGEDLAAFAVAQADAGCRNRDNAPDNLNNFKLVVSVGEGSVELTHGETASLTVLSRQYITLALRSVASVGDVFWTDAPTEHTSFVIARVPFE